MAARAFLPVDDELKRAFQACQDNQTVRCLRVVISAEDRLILAETFPTGASIHDDFNGLAEAVEEDTPCLLLFALDGGDSEARSSRLMAGRSRQWLLIAWVPDKCKVRQKMLYSSCRQDLRAELGLGYFEKGEYYANVKTDLTWAGYSAGLNSDNQDLLSETEVKLKELNKRTDTGLRNSAMGFIPFALSDELRGGLQGFAEGSSNLLEMEMEGEQVALRRAETVDSGAPGGLQQHITQGRAGFILLRHEGASRPLTFFVFHCPEDTPVRTKMTCSSSKASVLGAAEELGIKIDKTVEISEPGELDDTIKYELGGLSAPLGETQDSAPAAKPSRPGRGRARLTKRA